MLVLSAFSLICKILGAFVLDISTCCFFLPKFCLGINKSAYLSIYLLTLLPIFHLQTISLFTSASQSRAATDANVAVGTRPSRVTTSPILRETRTVITNATSVTSRKTPSTTAWSKRRTGSTHLTSAALVSGLFAKYI